MIRSFFFIPFHSFQLIPVTLEFRALFNCQKMERYPVGSTAKGAAPGERLFSLGERKRFVAVCIRLIVSTSSFRHDEYVERKYPFSLINTLDSYLLRRYLPPTDLVVSNGVMQQWCHDEKCTTYGTKFNNLLHSEIIGCCEIIEERINSSQRSSTKSERERRQTARHRPIIENLCVKEGYRECGVGMALIQACENAVVQLSRGYCDEVFTQVESGNVKAYNLFRKCGYQDHVTDPTCTIVALDKSPFARETTVTKLMMRKIMSY